MSDATTDSSAQAWLDAFIAAHGATNGTVHVRDSDTELALAAVHGIPEQVVRVIGRIPKGKGMAGLAWERDQPVSTCNLKTDSTGDVRPGARAVDARAAVALPVHDASGELRAVVGIAFAGEHELSDAELAELGKLAEALP